VDINLSKESAIILVGPPACGKTTLGKMLAQKLHVPFFDLDELIQEKYQVSIEALFSAKKESYFRVLETQCLQEFSKRRLPSCYILATGGGTVISKTNRQILKHLGQVIYLKASSEMILERLSEEEQMRPLFRDVSQDMIKIILNDRESYYKESDGIVEVTKGQSMLKLCQKLLGGLHGTRR